MKKASLLLTLLFLPTLACATATPASLKATSATLSHTDSIKETCTVTAALALNLRSDPGTSAAVTGTLKHGEILTILPHPAQGRWISVEAHGVQGWVNSNYCERNVIP